MTFEECEESLSDEKKEPNVVSLDLDKLKQNPLIRITNFKMKSSDSTNDENKKNCFISSGFICILLIIITFLITVIFFIVCYVNFYLPYKYHKVFDNVEVSSKLNRHVQLPSIELKFLDKNIQIDHNLKPIDGASNNKKYLNTFELFLESLSTFSKISGDYFNSQFEQNNYLTVFHGENFYFNISKLELSSSKNSNDSIDIQCYNVDILNDLSKLKTTGDIEACFSLNNSFWFGGHESLDQPYWPINSQNFSDVAYVTGFPDIWGAVVERYWISSIGLAIFLDDDVPLIVNHSDSNVICLKSSSQSAPYKYTPVYSNNTFNYKICAGPDPVSVHLYVMQNYYQLPKSRPDSLMMKSPVFTTWNYFFRHINQSVVLDFASQILANNYSISQLEIDDKWESFYGDLDFDQTKFPNVTEMVSILHAQNVRVTLWVHPFCNIDSVNFINGTNNGYWVLDPTGKNPAFTQWWNGQHTVILDTTNPNSVEYFTNKLNLLKSKYGIDSFKFDAGETSWCPTEFKFSNSSAKPDDYSRNYVRIAANQNNFVEVRTAHRIQEIGVFYRILDRATDWTIHDGIKSVVTQTLQFGLLGYPFVLPDIIGGNGDPDKSNKELFIRWTQLTAFLPAMQFGVPPWYFDNETNVICRKFVSIHEELVYPYIITLPLDGQPIIRPIWWTDTFNPAAYTIDDEFLVGDSILVAPVLDPGIAYRSIYLPFGEWYDVQNQCTYVGPINITEYNVILDTIPYFYTKNFAAKIIINTNFTKCS